MFMSTRGLKLYRCLQLSLLIKAHTGAVDIGLLAALFSIWPRISCIIRGRNEFPKVLGGANKDHEIIRRRCCCASYPGLILHLHHVGDYHDHQGLIDITISSCLTIHLPVNIYEEASSIDDLSFHTWNLSGMTICRAKVTIAFAELPDPATLTASKYVSVAKTMDNLDISNPIFSFSPTQQSPL
jgi:hypothetical protein